MYQQEYEIASYLEGNNVFWSGDNDRLIYTPFVEGTGTSAEDYSGNNHDGTITGASWVDGPFGKALDFERSENDYLSFGDHDDFSFGDSSSDSPFSIGLYIMLESIGTGQLIVCKNDLTDYEYEIYLDSSTDGLIFKLMDDSTGGYIQGESSPLSAGVAYYFTCTYDGSSSKEGITIYINGVEDTTRSSGGSYVAMESLGADLEIGRRGEGSNYFDGIIDEFKIYNYELDEHEIRQFSYVTPKVTTETVFQYDTNNEWDFSEDSYEDIYDIRSEDLSSNSDGILLIDSQDASFTFVDFYWDGLSIDASYYNRAIVRMKVNDTSPAFDLEIWDGAGPCAATDVTVADVWIIYELDLAGVWSDTETSFMPRLVADSGNIGPVRWEIDYVRLVHIETPSVYEYESHYVLTSSNNTYAYRIEYDGALQTYSTDMSVIWKNTTATEHSYNFTPYLDSTFEGDCFIAGESLIGTYGEEIISGNNPNPDWLNLIPGETVTVSITDETGTRTEFVRFPVGDSTIWFQQRLDFIGTS
jgi:hypothetical protein